MRRRDGQPAVPRLFLPVSLGRRDVPLPVPIAGARECSAVSAAGKRDLALRPVYLWHGILSSERRSQRPIVILFTTLLPDDHTTHCVTGRRVQLK